MKREKFNLKQAESDSIQKYVNFINDHNLSDELDNFETGYKAGMFFIIAEGKEDIISCIKRLSMKTERGKYKRTSVHRKLQSDIKHKKDNI